MKITNTIFAGLKIINSEKFTDSRGEFRELQTILNLNEYLL